MRKLLNSRKLKKIYRNSRVRSRWLSVLGIIFPLGFIGLIVFILLTTALFAWYARDLPNPDKIKRREGISTIIYDRTGKVLYDVYGDKNRIPVEFAKIPDDLKNATIAMEDKNFYKHQGFDTKGMLRAIFNIIFKHRLQGGSTLTQQLVKNVLLSSERTLPRKIKEFILATQIEKKYNKDEILRMYLNESPYGGTAWGVEAGAQTYFNKHVNELNLTESAILAGLPQKPTTYSPFGPNPKAYIERTKHVLRRMREEGYITSQQEHDAVSQLADVVFASSSGEIKAPHFVMFVKKLLVEKYGEEKVESGGLRVTTTLDLELQDEAQKIISLEIERMKNYKIGNGAAVVLNPKTGEILAMVGSKDYEAEDYEGKFNVAIQGLRQPGSAIKPITYATALKKGYTAGTLLFDAKTAFLGGEGQKDYVPENYDGKYRGPVQARFALGNSINVAAVKMLAKVGVKEMLKTAESMGLKTLAPTDANLKRLGLSVTLGGGEVTLLDLSSAFGVFATNGYRSEQTAILKITDSSGHILEEHRPSTGKKILDDDVCFLISHILSDNNARLWVFGQQNWLQIPGKTVAVKTGTTNDKRDNWTIGYTGSRVVGVWVGNNDNSSMSPYVESGSTGAAPIWNKIMRFSLKDLPNEEFAKPDNVTAIEIDAAYGGLPYENNAKRTEYFIKGTEPTEQSSVYQKLKISKETGKLANDLEISIGHFEEKDFIVFKDTDPVSADGRNRWQEAVDAWTNEHHKDDPFFHPPAEISDWGKDKVEIKIEQPGENMQIDDNDVKIKGRAFSLAEIVKMEIEVDADLKKTASSDIIEAVVNLGQGTHRIKLKGTDSKGNFGEKEIKIGIKVPWDWKEPIVTPEPTPSPSPGT